MFTQKNHPTTPNPYIPCEQCVNLCSLLKPNPRISCEGCEKHCELSATEYKNPCSAGFPNPYYYPTIDNIRLLHPSATVEDALLIAQQISEQCNKHKMNAK